jgi:hypothetical protein
LSRGRWPTAKPGVPGRKTPSGFEPAGVAQYQYPAHLGHEEQVVRNLAVIAAASLGVAAVSFARAEDAFYLGTWKFDSAVVAPWADPHAKADPKQKNALMGKPRKPSPALPTLPARVQSTS